MDVARRREPAFEAESEAYSLFTRGATFLKHRHPAQAVMYLSRALALEPGRNSIREALGRAEFAMGRHAEAAEQFAALAADVPDSDYAHYALGRCLAELGRGEEARTQLRLACALKPASRLYRAAHEALSQA